MGSIAKALQETPTAKYRTGYPCALHVRLAGADDEDRAQVARIIDGRESWSSRAASRILTDALGVTISDQMVQRHRQGVCRTCTDG